VRTPFDLGGRSPRSGTSQSGDATVAYCAVPTDKWEFLAISTAMRLRELVTRPVRKPQSCASSRFPVFLTRLGVSRCGAPDGSRRDRDRGGRPGSSARGHRRPLLGQKAHRAPSCRVSAESDGRGSLPSGPRSAPERCRSSARRARAPTRTANQFGAPRSAGMEAGIEDDRVDLRPCSPSAARSNALGRAPASLAAPDRAA